MGDDMRYGPSHPTMKRCRMCGEGFLFGDSLCGRCEFRQAFDDARLSEGFAEGDHPQSKFAGLIPKEEGDSLLLSYFDNPPPEIDLSEWRAPCANTMAAPGLAGLAGLAAREQGHPSPATSLRSDFLKLEQENARLREFLRSIAADDLDENQMRWMAQDALRNQNG